MFPKYLSRWIIINLCVEFLKSEDITLKCDSWDKNLDYLDADYGYCTITGLHVTHTQNVIVETPPWGPGRPLDATNFMKFYDSILLYVPQSIFNEFRNLKNLDISNSGIIEISRNTFSWASQLTWLNISQNNIRDITGSVFVGASSLRDLDLSHNRIQRLSEYSFNGLKQLINLDLSHNQIVDIERNLFSDNAIIEAISMKNNKIDHISADVFNKLVFLNMVDLRANNLVQIDPNTFKNCVSLRFLSLSKNKLKDLHLNVGEQFKILQADSNELDSIFINCTRTNSNQQINSSCDSLLKLRLSYNKLSSLVNVTRLPHLKELQLAHNNVGKLNISTFAKLNELEILDLKNTNLSGLTFGTFTRQTRMKFLDISNNNLLRLNLDMFLSYMYRNLEELYISGNNLTEITGRHSLLAFSSLKKLGLGRNQFNCSYLLNLISFPNLERQIEFPSDSSDLGTSRENIHGIECTHKEETLEPNKTLVETKSREALHNYEHAMHRLQLHEKQLEQHLLLMRSFVVIIAVLGLLAIVFKVVHFFTRNRGSWINTISYRSTNTIQSEVEVP